jgi:propionate kinase
VNGGEPARLAHQDYEGALAAIALELEKRNLMSSVALIGHRIAHGGDLFSESTLITKRLLSRSARFPRWRPCITTPT